VHPNGVDNANPQHVGSGSSSMAYQPLSARYGAGAGAGASAEYQPLNFEFGTSDSDANSARNMQYGGGAGGGGFSLSGWDATGVSGIFGSAASRDSLDELKRLCKDLLNEQQGLRAQLVNQSNAVNELRSAAAGRAGGPYRSNAQRYNSAVTRGIPTGARLHNQQNAPPPTGKSSYSARSVGPANGRRSSGRLAGRTGQQHLGSGYAYVPGAGPPNTAASIRSGAGSDRWRQEGINRRQHPGSGPPPGTGGSGSARQQGHAASMPPDGKSVHDGEGGHPASIEMPWGPVPEPAPMPKSPPIPTHRNRKAGAGGADKGPGPPKPRASQPKNAPGQSPPAGGASDGDGARTVSPDPTVEVPA
jgi:hypothetical protein